MPITNITPLPTPPTRSDPTNFATRADTFLTALPTMVTQFNTAADQIEAAELAAETAADTATAMATAAANSAGASVWVSGTSYSQYDPVVDPVDLKTYRAKNATSGVTRPGLDSANWAVTQGQGDVVLNGAQFAFRNHVINGCFNIAQRFLAYAGSLPLVSGGTYPANTYTEFDRWKSGASGATISLTGGSHTIDESYITYPHELNITAGSIRQILERVMMPAGTYYVTWIGTATARVSAGSGAASGTFAATGFSFVASGASDYSLEFTGGTVANVQVERGAITPFEFKPPVFELDLCRRYFWSGTLRTTGEMLVDKYGTATDQLAGLIIENVPTPGFRVNATLSTINTAVVPVTVSNLSSSAVYYVRGALRSNAALSATGRGYMTVGTVTGVRRFALEADFAG